jgi:hypothetical protein
MGLTAEASQWAVESWALALGVATDAEIEERRRKQSNPPSGKAGTSQPHKSENNSTNQAVSKTNSVNPAPLPKKQTPVSPPKPAPPVNRQPAKLPFPSPPAYSPANNRPPIQTPATNPQLQPSNPVVSKSRFGIFRGCLIIAFLLFAASIVLFLGVPYAIEVMRETQRERNNEPPRFPTR